MASPKTEFAIFIELSSISPEVVLILTAGDSKFETEHFPSSPVMVTLE